MRAPFRITARLALGALLLTSPVAIAGCGEKDEEIPTRPSREETRQPLPELPPGWNVAANRAQGFVFGLPPGWRTKVEPAGASSARPANRAIVVSITGDRTEDALAAPLRRHARAVLRILPRVRLLRVGKPRRFRGAYRGVTVTAAAKTKRGARQRLRVFALRRPGIATFTVLAAQPASAPAAAYRSELARMVRSLRSRPVQVSR